MSIGEASFYVTGGTLRHDAPSYVERQADKDLLDGLHKGEFCYVLTSRQMGKSSLMVRTAQKLREQKIDVIALDLTAIGLNLTPEQWYDGLIDRMGGQLRLEEELDEFWRASQRLSPVQRFFSAVREVVMKQRLGPLVIFVDEIDVVRSLPFSTDEFFAAIRECYNRRTEDSEFSRLTFCLLGVATPSDLIRDTRTTPFNIGRRIVLNDFTEKSALPLGQGLGREEKVAGALLKRILYWTNGHPYLTQRLCQALAQDSSVTGPAGVDRLCELLFLSNRARETDDNLLFVRERLLGSEADRASLLSLYEQVRRRGKSVRDDETNPLVSILRLSGIVRVVQGNLEVRNQIYFRVFDRDWVVANMPDAEVRRQRAAFRRGVVPTAAVALLIITAFALLAVYALRVAKEEARQRKLADKAKRETQEAYAQVSETLTRLEMQRAEELFSAGDSSSALAYLARMLRQNPTNRVAAERVLSALSHRSFAFPSIDPIKHEARVNYAQFSPDGQRVVTASMMSARIWDAKTGRPVTEPLKHESDVVSAQFSPDGLQVVTACGTWGGPNYARVWDANTGQPLTEPLKHGNENAVWSAQFSPDGQRVVTAAGDKTARVWDTQTGHPLTQPLKHENAVWSAQFSPDGQRVATASLDHTARVWDANTGQPLTEPLKHEGQVWSVRFSPDGQRVVTASAEDNTARVWDANTGQPLTEPLKHEGPVSSALFSPDGQRVVTASWDKTARVWDTTTGKPLTKPLKHEELVYSAQFSPDGRWVVTASWDGTARVWDATTGQPLTDPLKHEESVTSCQFSPDGQRLVTASKDTARVWDANIGQLLTERLDHEAEVMSCQFSPDGQRVATASLDHTARVWDANTGQPLTEPLKHEGQVWSVQFSPDGQRVVTACGTWGGPNYARVWDANTGQPLTEPLKHGNENAVRSAQFSPDGQRVVTAAGDKTARVWDTQTGQPLTEPIKHEAYVSFAQFSPDGQRVVTASGDKTARVWDANTAQPLTEPLKHDAPVMSAQFSPDGQRVVTTSDDNTARIWDANTGQPLTEPLKHEANIMFARFSPDGQRVVTASRVWDANTGQPLTEPLKHSSGLFSADCSPDGQRIVTASADNTARVWDATTGQPLTEPLKHEAGVLSAHFSPDGHRVVTASSKTARLWEVPIVSLPVPEWFPKLTQAIAGKRFNDHGISEPVPFAELLALKRQLPESSAPDVWTRWANWFFSDPAGRTISPFSNTTVPDYVQHRIEGNTLESLQDAVKVAPTNGLALARLTRAILGQDPARNPRQVGEASWLSLRAVKFAPEEAEAWWARAEALERFGNLSEALEAMISALRIQPQNAELWSAQGRMLEKTNRTDEAYQSFTKAIDVARAKSGSSIQAQAKFYLNRSNYLKRQNRLAEAAMDFCLAKNIPSREPQTKPDLIDLSLYYNASLAEKWHAGAPTDLSSSLRHGVQTLAGVEFDVRGLIQVGAETPTGEKYPKQVLDIAVGRECKRLHFLHSAINASGTKDGTQTGSYVIHYTDGQQRVIPLVIGQDLADWWSQPNEENKRFTIAWKGTNELSRQQGRTIRLFKTTWENPLPEVPVKSIDFVSTADEANPFLVAITAE